MIVVSIATFFIYAVFRDEIRGAGFMDSFLVIMISVSLIAITSLMIFYIKEKKEK